MNRRQSDVDHGVAIRMVAGLRNAIGAAVVMVIWIIALDLVLDDLEYAEAHRVAPQNFIEEEQ